MLEAGAALALLGGIGRAARAQSAREPPRELKRLVAANRILANEGVVDAFGHVSVRDPRNAARFWLSRSRSPALVELDDLMEFSLDGAAIDARGRTPYGERMIHAAIYAARGDVQSVVHNHAYDVLPFTITEEPLRPVVHTASVIGAVVPVWDIRAKFGGTDMLVRSLEQGRDLAATLANNTCALIRGHGAVVVGASIERAVLMCDGQVVHGHHLPPSLQTAEASGTVTRVSLADAVAGFEKDLLQDALKTTRGNRAKAARLLDTTERVLNYKVKKYGIDVRRFTS